MCLLFFRVDGHSSFRVVLVERQGRHDQRSNTERRRWSVGCLEPQTTRLFVRLCTHEEGRDFFFQVA